MIRGVKRVCLGCNTLTGHGSYCQACAAERERKRSKDRGARHYTYEYRKAAKVVRDNATQCWICGDGARPADPWTADHLVPGDPYSPLAAAHRSCNSRRGSKSITEMGRG